MTSILIYATRWCPYCERARQLFREKGREWEEIDLDVEPARRAEMIERSGRRTVPQIWIGDRHVGGFDDLAALEARGELAPLLGG